MNSRSCIRVQFESCGVETFLPSDMQTFAQCSDGG